MRMTTARTTLPLHHLRRAAGRPPHLRNRAADTDRKQQSRQYLGFHRYHLTSSKEAFIFPVRSEHGYVLTRIFHAIA